MKDSRVARLLPHTPPSRFIDEILESDQSSITCGVLVSAEQLYLRGGKARSVVCIEYMAQAIAAFAGANRTADVEPRIGYLIAARQVDLLVDAVHEGDSLRVEARRVWGDSALGNFECSVSRGGAVIASASLSVFMPDEPSAGDVSDAEAKGA